jgi:hypothetical protein
MNSTERSSREGRGFGSFIFFSATELFVHPVKLNAVKTKSISTYRRGTEYFSADFMGRLPFGL